MDDDFKTSVFYRAMMTSVFVGLFITIGTLVLDLVFLKTTGFPYSEMINVSSLIFGVNLLFLAIGVVYGFIGSSKIGNIVFMILIVLLTIFMVLKTGGVERSENPILNIEFRHLLSGLLIIAGLGALMIPVLFHNKTFEKHVL